MFFKTDRSVSPRFVHRRVGRDDEEAATLPRPIVRPRRRQRRDNQAASANLSPAHRAGHRTLCQAEQTQEHQCRARARCSIRGRQSYSGHVLISLYLFLSLLYYRRIFFVVFQFSNSNPATFTPPFAFVCLFLLVLFCYSLLSIDATTE